MLVNGSVEIKSTEFPILYSRSDVTLLGWSCCYLGYLESDSCRYEYVEYDDECDRNNEKIQTAIINAQIATEKKEKKKTGF